MLTEDTIREALRACFHSLPFNTPVDIVSLGLVVSIALTPDPNAPGAGIAGVPVRHSLVVSLVAPTADEDANTLLVAQTRNRLGGIPDLSKIEVLLTDSPAWSIARVAPETRRKLGLEPSPFAIINRKVR